MKKKRVTMLREAEAAFRWCVSFLYGDERKPKYQALESDLSIDARRMAMLLLMRHCLPGIKFTAPRGWDSLAELAAGVHDTAGLSEHFPELKGNGDSGNIMTAADISEMGFFYERMKNSMAHIEGDEIHIRSSRTKRKRSGTFFTPLSICEFMIRRLLRPVLEQSSGQSESVFALKVLDPAMGTGQFLLAASELLVETLAAEPGDEVEILSLRRRVFEECLFGIDLDHENVEMARFLLGLYTGRMNAGLDGIWQGDALIDSTEEGPVFGEDGFPEKIFAQSNNAFEGFDGIVGNPPYVASKNTSFAKYTPYLGGSSQVDYYLLFIHKYAARKYLRPGGGISFIVPDPLLLRGNAEGARRRLLENLHLESLLHIKGVFPRTSVANVIFLSRRNAEDPSRCIHVARLDTPRLVRAFRKRGETSLEAITRKVPEEYFTRSSRKEFRYLIGEETFHILNMLNSTKPLHPGPGIVVRPLQALARSKGAIFRGEEVGKDRIREITSTESGNGRLPMLMGGESITRYAVEHEGLFIDPKVVKKEIPRYRRHKILLQKSTGKLVAALDSRGYVVPQSVYGVMLDDARIGYPFLLTQLNSRLLNYFMHVMFTGYKLVQPQIEVEDIRQIPIMVPEFDETKDMRHSTLQTAKSLFGQYLRTDDPGWILEFVDDSIKLGYRRGSSMIHDLLDFLGGEMIRACMRSGPDALPKERLEWMIDLVIYKVFGLGLEEIETVESFFARDEAQASVDSPDPESPCASDLSGLNVISDRKPPLVFGEDDPDGPSENGSVET